MFARWGRFVYRFRWPVLALALALVAGTVVAIGALSTPLKTGDSSPDLESVRANALLDAELPKQNQGASFTLIFTPRDPQLRAGDPAFGGAVTAALAPLRADPRVSGIDYDPRSPTYVSKDGRRAFAVVNLRTDDESRAERDFGGLRAEVSSASLDVIATGDVPLNRDFNTVIEQDLQRAERLSLPLTLAVLALIFGMVLWRLLRRATLSRVGLTLALAFGALALALVPLLVGAFTLLGGVAGIYELARHREMSVYTIEIAALVGLGVAIDYSLFVVSRFLEEVATLPPAPAIERTMATTGKAIAFSGLTVAIGVGGLLFYHSSLLNEMGMAAMLVVVAALVYALTFLPALLSIAGNGVAALARRRGVRPGAVAAARPATGAGLWHGLALRVMAHPWLTLLPLLALLLLAGTPFLNLRFGLDSPAELPTSLESRRGWNLLTTQFAGSDNTSIPVVVDYAAGQPLTAARVAALYDYSRWLAGLPNVARVQSVFDPAGPDGRPLAKAQVVALLTGPPDAQPAALQTGLRQSVGAHIAVLTVATAAPANSDEAQALVRAIRGGPGPAAGGAVLVTGGPAFLIDQAQSIARDTRVAAAFIGVATYVVLFLLLGSVLLPLKAVAMNLLSLSASYGALVWIFQEGHLGRFLHVTPAPLNSIVPVLMFCLLFGLSMDYEVLLLSRMKEEYDRAGDNRHAVAEGLEQTGRLITGAAAIMVCIFGGFALADIVIVKALGVGMAVAVTVDALLVRTLVVPATMRLLGDRNWWAPAPLARLHRRLGLGHEEPGFAPAASTAAVAVALRAGDEAAREVVGAGRDRS